MNDDVEVLLEDAGAQWRAVQPPPDEPNWSRVTTRSKAPIWLAATVLAIAGVVAAFLTAGGNRSAPAHLKSAPVVRPLVPYPKGATVPPPMVVSISHPPPVYCHAGDLTGSVVFHGVTGELTLRLRPGRTAGCALPTMVPGDSALRLVDHAGRTRGHGINPESMFPTNPPGFWYQVGLLPGQEATMHLRAHGATRCATPITHAVLRYDDSNLGTPLTIPVTGARYCDDYFYGPFSTPGHTVTFENPGWSDLDGMLDFPAQIGGRDRIAYRITLANRGKNAVPLQPCTKFYLELSNERRGVIKHGPLGCDTHRHFVIQPGTSISLDLACTPTDLQPGKYTVEWAIAGMNAARAHTTVR